MFNHTAANYIFAPAITSSGAGIGTVCVEAGTTILTATNTYTGATIIDGGTLSVNGSIASSAVTVNAGGALGGNGIVGNTTINGGTLAPGNLIGLLTVNGNLSFTSASTYMVEVSPSNADRVNVTGTATLSGATVNASFAAGSLVAKQYTIVNAGGGISGTFGSGVNSNLPSGIQTEPELRRQQRLSRSGAGLRRSAQQRPQRQPVRRRQRAGQLLQPQWRHSAGLWRAGRAGTDAGLRPDRHRGAADHGSGGDAVHDPDHRSLRRRPRRWRAGRDGIR